MQVARYWRMKQHLYRLQGYVQETGKVTLDTRSQASDADLNTLQTTKTENKEKLATVA
jgi:hypothetical protein